MCYIVEVGGGDFRMEEGKMAERHKKFYYILTSCRDNKIYSEIIKAKN